MNTAPLAPQIVIPPQSNPYTAATAAALGAGTDPISDFVHIEKKITSPARTGAPKMLSIGLNSALRFHRVYCFIEATLDTLGEDYWCRANLVFKRGGRQVGLLPVSIGQNDGGQTEFTRCGWSACTGAGDPGPETMLLMLSTTVKGATARAFLNPAFIECAADEVVLNLLESYAESGVTITEFIAALAVRSANTPR